MSLYWMEDGKQAIDLPRLRKKYYFSVCCLLKEISTSEDMLFNYVTDVINDQCEIDDKNKIFFRPGFTFSENSIHWNAPRPLSKLWQSPPDGLGFTKQIAGNFLGLLVYKYMLASEESWYCTKTYYNNRPFDTMVYWKK
jgi:hypothetical protein